LIQVRQFAKKKRGEEVSGDDSNARYGMRVNSATMDTLMHCTAPVSRDVLTLVSIFEVRNRVRLAVLSKIHELSVDLGRLLAEQEAVYLYD
jgi:hypothetical protein